MVIFCVKLVMLILLRCMDLFKVELRRENGIFLFGLVFCLYFVLSVVSSFFCLWLGILYILVM